MPRTETPGSSFVGVYGLWQDAADDAENTHWVHETSKRLEPTRVGHYVGEADLTANADRAKCSFAPANWQRLAQLRAQHDPDHLFFNYLTSA